MKSAARHALRSSQTNYSTVPQISLSVVLYLVPLENLIWRLEFALSQVAVPVLIVATQDGKRVLDSVLSDYGRDSSRLKRLYHNRWLGFASLLNFSLVTRMSESS